MSVTIDKGHDIPVFSKVCSYCRHLSIKRPPGERTCLAFPNGIPLHIWLGKHLHTKVLKNQKNKIIFTPYIP